MEVRKPLTPDTPKVIRTHGVLFCNDDLHVNTSLETHDINIYGELSIEGSLTSRHVTTAGSLDVQGSINADGHRSNVEGDLLCGANCNCHSICSNGYVLIGGNCFCVGIDAADDVCILGTFNNPIENIKVPENKHIYINGKCVK